MAAPTSRDIPKAKLTKESISASFGLFKYINKTDRWIFGIGTIFLALTAATSLMFPEMLGKLFNAGSAAKNDITESGLKKVAYGFIYLFIAQAVFSFLRIWTYVRVSENLTYQLRNRLYKSVLFQQMEFFSKNRVGDLLSRFSADIAQIQDTFASNIAIFLRQILIIIGGIIYIVIKSPSLSVWMLAIIPPIIIISLFFGKFIRKYSKQVQELTGKNNVVVEETLSGIVNVKSYTNENFEIERFENSAETLRKQSINRGLLRGAFSSFIIVFLFGAFVLLIFIGLNMVQKNEMQIGELISFVMITGFVGGSIGGLAEQFVQIQKTVGAVDRVLELIESKDLENENAYATDTKSPFQNGSIEFKHVKFAYPTRDNFEVLSDLNLDIPAGKTLAIVGPSGAGKSTLVQLLYRFYSPTSGHLLLNNLPIEAFDLMEYRSHFALVPQEVMLFGGSIFENIAYGKINSTKAEVEEAAKKANAHLFIESFPEKYDTLVGDRGIKLSGGQRQRIAIARAILRNPEVLILDEATSSLDTESEIQVQQALNKLMQNRTSIVIAHRLSTIKNADKIVVLKSGNIMEQGSHEELMQIENGMYKTMVEKQIDPQEFWNNTN